MPHDHGAPHRHPNQPDHPEPLSPYELLGVALNELLIEKRIYSADEMRAMIEEIESADAQSCGAQIVVKAWLDDEFRATLRMNASEAIRSLGLNPGYTEVMALENTPEVHNVVVCTLCSCYPRWLLGRPPAWYKSGAYRSRVVREPRSVLSEFGTHIPSDIEVRVHDSNAELRYIVIPMRPEGTEGWSFDRLSDLVSRDSMIGVTQAKDPACQSAVKL